MHRLPVKTLNIVGAGRVGRALGRLWQRAGVFDVQDVLSGTPHGARSAVAFIGTGHASGSLDEMRPAEVWMLTPPDARIASCCAALAAGALLRAGDIVFHCSGSLSSQELAGAASRGAKTASVHPLKSFADPRAAVDTFAGTCCAVEGDGAALEVLRSAFERIGARVAEIEPGQKTIYHAASVIVCNYLVALMETGLRCYEQSGIGRETALAMMAPLVRETVENVLTLGPARALTGPIARGDDAVVAGHLKAIEAWDTGIGALYRQLGTVALELARAQGEAGSEALARLADVLRRG